MVKSFVLTLATIFLSAPTFAQEECAGLAPKGGEDLKESFKGSIEGEVEGIVSKLVSGSASIEGEYLRLETDTLKDYPEANKVFVWQSIIYLACVRPDAGIDINKLFELYLSGPPSVESRVWLNGCPGDLVYGEFRPESPHQNWNFEFDFEKQSSILWKSDGARVTGRLQASCNSNEIQVVLDHQSHLIEYSCSGTVSNAKTSGLCQLSDGSQNSFTGSFSYKSL
ncbi:hypothetical protein [Shimia sp. R9_3]|uniref:hypothetical protein n=1 Tax=Shimia sp. R9_3 TaxID=2821113 RepID=UPI001AD9D848|nr:hypothetical protein [Shimia sp. R9_3]MBO9402857.1 hypothetical protein [Shimia sp. R9_3]